MIGGLPTVFAVSSRQARQAKETFDADERTRLWAASRSSRWRATSLARWISERVRSKLASPLAWRSGLVERYLTVAEAAQSPAARRRCHGARHRRAVIADEGGHAAQLQYRPEPCRQRALRDGRAWGRVLRQHHPPGSGCSILANADKASRMFEREVVRHRGAGGRYTHEPIMVAQQDFTAAAGCDRLHLNRA